MEKSESTKIQRVPKTDIEIETTISTNNCITRKNYPISGARPAFKGLWASLIVGRTIDARPNSRSLLMIVETKRIW